MMLGCRFVRHASRTSLTTTIGAHTMGLLLARIRLSDASVLVAWARIAALRLDAFQLAEKQTEESGYYHYVLGDLHRKGIATMASDDKVLAHYKLGCEGFDPQSCLVGGTMLASRVDASVADRAQARAMLERACAASIVGGCEALEKARSGASSRPNPAVAQSKKNGCAGCESSGMPNGGSLVVLALGLLIGGSRRTRASKSRNR